MADKTFMEVKRECMSNVMAHTNGIDRICEDLRRVGMNFVADKIFEHTSSIFESVETLDKAFDSDLFRQLKDAQQSSINMLNATMAGIELAKQTQTKG